MKLHEVEVGGRYAAKVSGIITTVRVLAIREVPPAWHNDKGNWRKRIDVVNERTGRRTTFASAAKLRHRIDAPEAAPVEPKPAA
ncbi:MAG: hypothetical protein IT438_15015 [Phycisphaerales bacterium]|nr:hypothetical protein [Phycisphaerales bacterium]